MYSCLAHINGTNQRGLPLNKTYESHSVKHLQDNEVDIKKLGVGHISNFYNIQLRATCYTCRHRRLFLSVNLLNHCNTHLQKY